MFYLGGVGLAFFLTILLLSKSNKTVADKILAGWLFVMTIHLLLYYFLKTERYPQLLGSQFPFPLLHGPFLFLYTRALTKGNVSLKFSLVHFAPAIAVLLYLIPFFALPTDEKIFVFKNQGVGYEVFNVVNLFMVIASGIFYVILSSMALRKHRISIEQEFSSTDKINLQWLQYLIYWIGAIWILVIIGNDTFVFGAAVLFLFFIGFFGIRQVGIFQSQKFGSPSKGTSDLSISEQLENDVRDELPEKRKYLKSGLTSDGSERLHRDLSLLMKNEKLFRESELSLTELARRLNTQPNYLSQVINEREGKIFYDYINTIRIEEFKRLATLPENRKYTLVGLAQQCGFNSKSTFNRYFKKVTGQSPSEFMKAVSELES